MIVTVSEYTISVVNDGVGIASSIIDYAVHSSGIEPPGNVITDGSGNPILSNDGKPLTDGSWSTTIPTVQDGQYLWTRTRFILSDGSFDMIYNVSYSGEDGEAGEQGISVIRSFPQWRLSDSSTSMTGSGEGYAWQDTKPTVEAGQYIWERYQTELSNGTYISTDAYCDTTMSGVLLDVNNNKKAIAQKVWATDINTSINQYDGSTGQAIRDRVSQTETKISGITSTVSDMQSTLSTKADGSTVTELQSVVSQNKQTADAFQQTVTSSYAKLTDVDDKIDNIKVGGNNLYIIADETPGYINGSNGSISSPSSTYKEFTSDYIPVKQGEKYVIQSWCTPSATGESWLAYQYYSNDTGTPLGNRVAKYGKDSGSGVETTAEGQEHLTYKITVPENADYIRISYRQFADGYAMVEKATTPSEYAINPRDLQSYTDDQVQSVRTYAEQTADKFTWLVESGDSSSNFILTDRTAQLVSDYINLNGTVTFSAFDADTQNALTSGAELIVGTQTASTSAWTGKSTKLKSLASGTRISYKLPYASTSTAVTLNLTLNNNTTTGAKNVYYLNDTRLTTQYGVNSIVELIYDGSAWRVINPYSDANTYDRTRYQQAIKAGSTAIVAGNIIVAGANNVGTYTHLKLGNAFDTSYPILYAGSAISANGTGTNNFLIVPMGLTTTQSGTYTAYKSVYIKGTLSGTTFTPVSTTPLTQTIPTSADNYHYMLLGTMYSTTEMYLLGEHPIFQYYNGGFKTTTQIAAEAAATANTANSTANTAIKGLKSYTGTSSTATGTAAKVVSCSDTDFEMTNGVTITITFSAANTADAPTLNVNSKGAKNIYFDNAVTSSSNKFRWQANSVITFQYNGTYWVVLHYENLQYFTSSTAAGTAAKTNASATGTFVLCRGTTINVFFSTANSANAPTLNIGSTGAYAIYYKNVVTSSSNKYLWDAGTTITFTFNGSYWYINDGGAQLVKDYAKTSVDWVGTNGTAVVTAKDIIGNWATDATKTNTTIKGGLIQTHTISSEQLATNAIMSNNYSSGVQDSSIPSGHYSTTGTFLDLSDGAIYMPNFGVSSTGEVFMNGTVYANAGQIGDPGNAYWKIGTVYGTNWDDHAGLIAHGDALIQAGKLTMTSDRLNSQNAGSYVKIGDYWYDFGMQVPDPSATGSIDGSVHKQNFLYIRRIGTQPTSSTVDNDWNYLFRVNNNGDIYWNGHNISEGTYLPLSGGTLTGDLTVSSGHTITGTLSGNASTATQWASAQKVYVTLGTASTTTTIQGGSTSAQTIGVNGTLGVGNGGTGATTFTSGAVLIGNGSGAIQTRGIRNNTTAGALGWTASGTDNTIITTNTLAYWDGRYQTTNNNSNIEYVKLGKLGTVVTHAFDEFITTSGGTVSGALSVTDLSAGDLVVTGAASFTNGLSGDLTGNVTGNATTATTATKVQGSLKIQLNSGTTEGTNQFTYNGEAGKTVNITKGGLGLANVENTALSTWAGSANLTTTKVGTLAAAATKGVDTSISSGSSSGNVPTTAAVASFVEGKGYVTSSGVTSVRVQATSPVVSSTNTAQTSTLNTTISLADAYGDTKNPYGTKTPNYVLAGPSSGTTNAAPSFRALVAADIPSLTKSKISDFPTTWALSSVSGADDLKAIEALTGTSGFLKKTAANTWTLDTNTYVTSSGVTSITLSAGEGISLNATGAITTTGTRTITNSGVRAVTESTTNGSISVNTNGTTTNVAVHGLGDLAYKDSLAKGDVGLGSVTNNRQVKGLPSNTTEGHFVLWGTDGYTVTDGGIGKGDVVAGVQISGSKLTITKADGTSSESDVTIIASQASGATILTDASSTGLSVGDASHPTYFASGIPVQGNVIPTITLNGTANTSPSFFAPTAKGSSGQVLKSNGNNTVSWMNQSDLSVGSATNATNATNATTATNVSTQGASTSNENRHVWFSSSTETKRAHDDDFKYNPSTNTLTVANVTGNAGTATKWASAQTVYVALGTASKTTSIQGGSSSAVTLGVDGTLGVANGGTGKASWTQWGVLYASASTTLANTGAGSAGQVLQSNGSSAPTWITATNSNTASTIVKRDGSGNFSAGTITAALTGNATSASKFNSSRTISLSGDVSGSASGDGSSGWSITTTVADNSHNHDSTTIVPIATKTYTDVIAAANDEAKGQLYFMKVLPDSYTGQWEIHYKVSATITGVSAANGSGHEDSDVYISGMRNTYAAYKTWNNISNTSYRPYYYHCLYRAKEAGITGGYGHALGINLRYSWNPATAANVRTVTFEIIETKGCTVTFFDAPSIYANLPGTGTTNYDNYTNFDATTQGNTMTGDRNDVNYYNRNYYGSRVAAAAVYRYQLCLTKKDRSLLPINSVNNSTATDKVLTTEAFDPFGDILYWSSTTTYAAGANVGDGWYSQYLADIRYSFNIGGYQTTSTLVARKPLYLVATPQADGTAILHSSPLAQDLPTTEDGLIYIYLGQVYQDTNPYRLYLTILHPVYYYIDGGIQLYTRKALASTNAEFLTHKTVNNTSLHNTAGTFAFSGSGDPWSGTDWVGLQVGDSADKFQITVNSSNHMLLRHNDSGGTNASWQNWVTMLDSSNYNSYSPKLDGTGATGTWGIGISGLAAKATADASGNTITSYYCTLSTAQTVSGVKTFSGANTFSGNNTFSGVNSFTNTTASTSKSTGAVKVSGGIGVAGRMSANENMIGDHVVLSYNSTLSCLDFSFV